MSATVPHVSLPTFFGADEKADVFFQPYTNKGRAIRSQVTLTHHLLSLVQEGEKEVFVAMRSERIDASRMVLLAANPSIMSEHNLNGSPMRSLLLFLSRSFLFDFAVRHGLRAGGQAAGSMPLPQDEFTRTYARSIELMGPGIVNASAAMRRTKADEILLYLHAKHTKGFAAFMASALADHTDLPLRAVVDQHQDGNLTIPELAFLCHMSVSTFKRRFLESFGVAPGRYLHERRMQRARDMLQRKLRPSEVYLELGYASLAAFSTEFKKHFGVAPTGL